MHESERHRVILAAVQARPVATVSDLVELTGTSEDPRGIALPPPDASESSGGTARHLVIFAAVIFFLFFLLRSNRTAEGQPPELQGKPVERIPANLAPPPPELPRPQAP